MASCYIEGLQTIQPVGPYYLGGWSLGGIIAWEMAQQLSAAGEEVALLALIDSYSPVAIDRPEQMGSGKDVVIWLQSCQGNGS